MDRTTLDTLKSSLRRLLTESISDCIAELKQHLQDFFPKHSTLLLLESRLNDANLQNMEGTISEADLQLRYNQIRADLLLFINGLQVNDFEMPAAGTPAAKTGSLLYKIPTQMTLQKETKCLVRLAFDKASIIRNIELTPDVAIKSVRVAEVMQVELIDPSDPHPFSIRSISDEEQFVEKDDYSEWVFYVKPLLEGTFPLVLKISVIEVVMGKERLRNLTYEENIQIVATAAEEKEPDFKPIGVIVGKILPPASDIDSFEREDVMPAAPYAPAHEASIAPVPKIPAVPVAPIQREVEPLMPAPEIAEGPPTPQKRRNPIAWMTAAASVLLIVTVAIFSINNNTSQTKDFENFPPSIVEQDSLTVIPDSIYRDTLMTDSLK